MRNSLERGLGVLRRTQGFMLRVRPLVYVHIRSSGDRGSLVGHAMPLQNLTPSNTFEMCNDFSWKSCSISSLI